MAGYGPEDDHFVVELTYNYGLREYKLGNGFQVRVRQLNTVLQFLGFWSVFKFFYTTFGQGLTISSSEVIKRFKNADNSILEDNGVGRYTTQSPDGYMFCLIDKEKDGGILVYIKLHRRLTSLI